MGAREGNGGGHRTGEAGYRTADPFAPGTILWYPVLPVRNPEDELRALDDASLRRTLRTLDSAQGPEVAIHGRKLLNFSSNDYLGLACDAEIKAAFRKGIEEFGTGSGASRLICGGQKPHATLEETLAEFLGTEASLTFATGYATALGTVAAVAARGDVIIADKLCHASLIDAARLSGATLRVFPHNRIEKLESHLKWAGERIDDDGRILVATESVFSMDGDRARLREIVDLKDAHGAVLLLDEAHAFGILGRCGRGFADETDIASRVDLLMGTLGKAAGVGGGFIAASRPWIDLLVNHARSFIFSTAPPAAQAVAAKAALGILASKRGDALREQLWRSIRRLGEGLGRSAESAIVPMVLGEEEAALEASRALLEQGILIPAIRYPTVARGSARLRITLSAAHSEDQIDQLIRLLKSDPLPS